MEGIEKYLNKVIQGDCLEVIKEIPDKSIDLVVTDPPYAISLNGGGSIKKKIDYRRGSLLGIGSNPNFTLIPFLEVVRPKLKNFHAYIWMSKDTLPETLNWILKNKFMWNILIWSKTNPVPAYNNTYLSDIEYCMFIREKGGCHWTKDLGYETYKKVMIDHVQSLPGHPTPKPLWMMEKLIKVSSKPGDLILEPFAGSGTTCIAARNLKRNFIGIEINEEYAKYARDRLKQDILF